MRVQFYQRKPCGAFSLERVFHAVRDALPSDIDSEIRLCRFVSRRFLRRLLNLMEAPLHQRDVNHIVGDVHYLAMVLSKRKTILTVHDCGGLRLKKGLNRLFLLWFLFWMPVRRVAAVTVISEFTRDELLHYTGCNPNIVSVIPDPVPQGFTPFPKPFNSSSPIILQVGTGEHNKNVCRVAESLRGVPCRLDIVGRLSERQRQVLSRNEVSYTEQWDLSDQEMIQKYRECDLLVFVSTYEGFGMPILEANATGRPVVTSNLAPMPEVAGSAACLVDPFDTSSIREGILRVIGDADYRDCLVVRGFENAKRFQATEIAAQYAALYRKLK